MTARPSVKVIPHHRIVGIITSQHELRLAIQLSRPPDLLELRLDHLIENLNQVEKMIFRLPAPLIITARDFREGGANRLSLAQRCDLLLRFLRHAAFVDLELRSMHAFAFLLELPPPRRIQRIISSHHLETTPTLRVMMARARLAKSRGADIFKLVTRVDSPLQLARLIQFMGSKPSGMAVTAMGLGKLGNISRLALAQCGSVLTYARLGEARLEGQPSLEQVRAALDLLEAP